MYLQRLNISKFLFHTGADLVERVIYFSQVIPTGPISGLDSFSCCTLASTGTGWSLSSWLKPESNPINAALPCPLASCRSNDPKGFRSFIAAGRQQGSNLPQKTYNWVCNSQMGKAAGISAWLRIAWLRPVTLTGTTSTLHLKMVI